jgi:hypothetical protein
LIKVKRGNKLPIWMTRLNHINYIMH